MERPEFDRLLTANLPRIENAAKKYSVLYGRLHEWEDITQTALLKMLRFADLYDPGKGDLLPWACVIICNTIKTHIAQSMNVPDVEAFNTVIIDSTLAQSDCNPENCLQASLISANLNRETRLFIEGYNYAEIARMQGVNSKVTAKNRIDKCAARLRRIMGIDIGQGRRVRNVAIV